MKETTVDVLVLDVSFTNTEMQGAEVAKYVKQHHPQTKILILSYGNNKDVTLSLMEIGVSGYVLKEKSSEELVQAIKTVAAGQSYFGLKVLNTIGNTRSRKKNDVHLTEREKEVLCLIARCKESKEISEMLYIALGTVNTHRKNLLSKTRLRNDKELVIYALKYGYIDIDDIDLNFKE